MGLPADRVREGVLLATVINHPDILDRVAERLGMLMFGDSQLDSLRAEILITYGAKVGMGDHLDRDALVDHLRSTGLGAAIDRVLGPQVCMHASFARAHASRDAALAGWEHVHALHGRAALEQDLRAAEDRLANTMTDDALARVGAIRAGRDGALDPFDSGAVVESAMGDERPTTAPDPDVGVAAGVGRRRFDNGGGVPEG